MPAGTMKLGLINALAYELFYNLGLAAKPVVTVGAGTTYTDYDNLTAAQTLAKLFDGSQDLPVFFTSQTARIKIDFGAACIPLLFFMFNHNCVDTDDFIEIFYSDNDIAYTQAVKIESPDRSVDKFYPLGFNDAWFNVANESHRYWAVDLDVDDVAVKPYLGELFIAVENYGYVELDAPGPDVGNTISYQRNEAVILLECGSDVRYIRRRHLSNDLANSRRGDTSTEQLIDNAGYIHAAAARQSPYRHALVLNDDRLCLFGKLQTSGGISQFPDTSMDRQLAFVGDYPRNNTKGVFG